MKKTPMKKYAKVTGKKAIIGTMADEGRMRRDNWLKHGCNAFESDDPKSAPLSFWTEQDVLRYIKKFNLKYAEIYGDLVNDTEIDGQIAFDFAEPQMKLKFTGARRTGCIFCGYGCHLEKSPNRFERLKETHPRQYEYCIGGGEYNSKGMWIPNKEGLGLGHVFDELNKVYGDDFINY